MILIDDCGPEMDPVEWGKLLLGLEPPLSDVPRLLIDGTLLVRLCDVGDDWAMDLDAVLAAQVLAATVVPEDLETHRLCWSGAMFARLVEQAATLRGRQCV